jgi:multicomponent Na+:H+ antiporter subunit E
MTRILLFAVATVVIFEGDVRAIYYMAGAVAVATLVSRRLPARRPARVNALGLLAFLPYFLKESVRGGVDVAVRAFRGPAALQPGFIEYRVGLRGTAARIVFVNSVSLMPGTFTARLDGDVLRVHALDTGAQLLPRLRTLEQRLHRVFPEQPT